MIAFYHVADSHDFLTLSTYICAAFHKHIDFQCQFQIMSAEGWSMPTNAECAGIVTGVGQVHDISAWSSARPV